MQDDFYRLPAKFGEQQSTKRDGNKVRGEMFVILADGLKRYRRRKRQCLQTANLCPREVRQQLFFSSSADQHIFFIWYCIKSYIGRYWAVMDALHIEAFLRILAMLSYFGGRFLSLFTMSGRHMLCFGFSIKNLRSKELKLPLIWTIFSMLWRLGVFYDDGSSPFCDNLEGALIIIADFLSKN